MPLSARVWVVMEPIFSWVSLGMCKLPRNTPLGPLVGRGLPSFGNDRYRAGSVGGAAPPSWQIEDGGAVPTPNRAPGVQDLDGVHLASVGGAGGVCAASQGST